MSPMDPQTDSYYGMPDSMTGKVFGQMSQREKSILWALIRQDAYEAARRFRHSLCGPCVLGLHDLCPGGCVCRASHAENAVAARA